MVEGRPPVVVVVEDHDDSRELLVDVLEVAGFTTRAAATVAEAGTLLASEPADALIADFSLPDGSGGDLLVACGDARPRVCVLLTGFDASAVNTGGFDVVLKKPVDLDALVTALRARL